MNLNFLPWFKRKPAPQSLPQFFVSVEGDFFPSKELPGMVEVSLSLKITMTPIAALATAEQLRKEIPHEAYLPRLLITCFEKSREPDIWACTAQKLLRNAAHLSQQENQS